MRWCRLYAEMPDDSKLRLLAFEDRWHFVSVLCMKASGMLDSDVSSEMLDRMVAVKLGLTQRECDEVRKRLMEVTLIGHDWQPTNWSKRQFESDSSASRVKKYRQTKQLANCNGSVTLHGRYSNALDTDTDTDTDTELEGRAKPRRATALPPDFLLTQERRDYALSKDVPNPEKEFEAFRAHHEAHGKVMKSWDAAWRTWCMNSKKFRGYEPPRGVGSIGGVLR